MNFFLRTLALLLILLVGGCANTSHIEDVTVAEEARISAKNANESAAASQRTANQALIAAKAAQRISAQALMEAKSAQQSADRANEKVDRAFKKSMEK